ncbi:capsid protein [Clostridium botulinum]|uniref:Capsid protein n=2 Tax=Clostridium botulinum TaxID=1491 RepID=A0A846I6T6_CLOBO|nr:putative lipoprotein [Clostridium botulinum Ba4 str. 657]AJE11299.1 ATP synthase F1, gamma subunit [Clostridium botulinum CDC_1436]AUN01507.1 capsid protein [Clostridium botulinum]AUN03378.1 capsid protein [Clostridium botulinum]AXG90917.1 capsid protein [Clostridium botulinum]
MKLKNLFISGLSVLSITTMLMTSTVSAACSHDWTLTGHKEDTQNISHSIKVSVPGGYRYETCTAYKITASEGYKCKKCGQTKHITSSPVESHLHPSCNR